MAAIRRPLTRAAAVATAVTLGAGALTLPALAADGEKAAPPKLELKNGTLDWGLKQSFRAYVLGIAHGRIEAKNGAKQAADNGVFTFGGGKGTYDTGTHATDTAFRGGLRFTSTAHRFDIGIADVKVRTKGTTGAIRADVTLNGTVQNDIDLAELDLSAVRPGEGAGGAMVFKDIPATLTKNGAKAFNGMYAEGEKLDPATLTVTAGGPVTRPEPTPTTPGRPTGTPKPPTGTTKPTARPTGAAKPSAGIVDGSLSWGLKKSFRSYITSGGKATVAGGAKKTPTGYRFPHAEAEVRSAAKKADATFKGSVRFTYAAHGIDMKFSDIKVRARGTKGTLLVDVTTPRRTSNDVKFATLDLAKASYRPKNGVVVLDKLPATLTAAGARQFANDTTGSPYRPGEKLDPVTVALSARAGAALPAAGADDGGQAGGTSAQGSAGSGSVGSGAVGSGSVGPAGGAGELAETGASVPSGALLGAAGVALVAGAGAVVVGRRRRGAEAV
ncbi:HtaA domain-containing protein [Streptomyces sp. NPDC047123]|uniref:HtaA domain-containing protein n=1 Tax=Streptomyces sp. NPDC047123 TaxID=3155622 RepID=UPI0033C7211B